MMDVQLARNKDLQPSQPLLTDGGGCCHSKLVSKHQDTSWLKLPLPSVLCLVTCFLDHMPLSCPLHFGDSGPQVAPIM